MPPGIAILGQGPSGVGPALARPHDHFHMHLRQESQVVSEEGMAEPHHVVEEVFYCQLCLNLARLRVAQVPASLIKAAQREARRQAGEGPMSIEDAEKLQARQAAQEASIVHLNSVRHTPVDVPPADPEPAM